MQALVTGATGLLGRHLVAVLVEAGTAVRALVRPTSDTRHLKEQGVELVYGAAGNQGALYTAVQGAELIFHAAGYLTANAPFGVDGSADNEWPLYKTINVEFTEALLEAALDSDVSRFLYVSSSSVYSSDVAVPTPEDAPLIPISTYGRSKLLAEEKVRLFQARGLPTTIIRPPVIYGPGDRYFTPLALRLARLPLLPLVNGGRNLMDLVYVVDVAQLLWRAAEREAAVGRTYNAGPGRSTTLYDLVQAFRRTSGRGPVILPVSPRAAGRTSWLSRRIVKPFFPEVEGALTSEGIKLMSRDHHLDMSRAANELDFHPQFNLDQGLALTLGSAP
jgi:nucleoside-diphosphate-sugar epimerase